MAPPPGQLHRAAIALAAAPRYHGGPAAPPATCAYCGGEDAVGMLVDDPDCTCGAVDRGKPHDCICVGVPRPACAVCRGDTDQASAPPGYEAPKPSRAPRPRAPKVVRTGDGPPRCQRCNRRIPRKALLGGAVYCSGDCGRRWRTGRYGKVQLPVALYDALVAMAAEQELSARALLEQWIAELPAPRGAR